MNKNIHDKCLKQIVVDNQDQDLENQEINPEECCICLEVVDDISYEFKFNCNHQKYMHQNCINTLKNCPLCRVRIESSDYPSYPSYNRSDDMCFVRLFFSGCIILTILFIVSITNPGFTLFFINSSNNSTQYNSTNI